jgi:hypothetical protein
MICFLNLILKLKLNDQDDDDAINFNLLETSYLQKVITAIKSNLFEVIFHLLDNTNTSLFSILAC